MRTQVLIIGSGIAGASAALFLAEKDVPVIVVTRAKDPHESNTKYAQGGIVGTIEEKDRKAFIHDVIRAGNGMNLEKAVEALAQQGPALVKDLLIDTLQVPFSHDDSGAYSLTKEGGHSQRRILHEGDRTGKVIEAALIKKIKNNPCITILQNSTAVDLITVSHHSKHRDAMYEGPTVLGAYILDNNTKRVKKILAGKTILATGGCGQLYLYTTNPEGARGDGLSMAYRAGARIINTEYIQFHPTSLYHKESSRRFLITEAIRGEGARLKNQRGEYFMKRYDKRAELAPRDIVSRAIYSELIFHDEDFVWLDLTPLVKKGINLKKRFPTVFDECQKYGIDIQKESIPVVPAAHYFCGGVAVDEWGKTSLKNLYAIGEVSCTGVHGANRLASTSLLEGLVWGKQSTKDIANILSSESPPDFKKWAIPSWDVSLATEEIDPALILQDVYMIRSTMWNYVGIVRRKKRLERAVKDLGYLRHRIEDFYCHTKLTDSLVGLRNSVQAALIIAHAALRNRESRGCHYRID
ncbi:L-aspartate oxidase [Patescibacteria group bacterium AH-259-L07]|nr:L-aspartate oxidase [Patescibacteria group bacterium AH-259-L07]